MEWPIRVDLGTGYYLDATLTVRESKNEVIIEFIDTLKETMVLDTLSSFQMVQFDEENPLRMTLYGKNVTRSFIFFDDDGMSNVWMYFQNFVDFVLVSSKTRTFMIVPKKQRSLKETTFETITSLIGVPQKKTEYPREVPRNKPEAISSNLISESISFSQLCLIGPYNYQNFFENGFLKRGSIHLYEIEFKEDFIFDLWCKLLKIEKSAQDLIDYKDILSQWKPLPRTQWCHDSFLRTFVVNLEQDLSQQKYSIKSFEQLTFEVIFSNYIYQFKPDTYDPSFLRLFNFILTTFIVNEGNYKTYNIQNGENITFEEASFRLFLVYSKFYDIFSPIFNDKFLMKEIYDKTMQTLSEQSPSTCELMKTLQINDFEFLSNQIKSLLIYDRSKEDSQLVFTVVLTSKSIHMFFVCFFAAACILLHGRLAETPFERIDIIKELFVSYLSCINLRLLLYNTERLIELYLDEE